MSAKPKLYIDLLSQPCRAVFIFVKINKIDLDIQNIALFKGEHKEEWFQKLTPMAAVPMLDDNGFILTECGAILQYLGQKYKAAGNWYPTDVRQAARVEEYVMWHYCSGGLRPNGVGYFVEKVLKPMRTGNPPSAEDLKAKADALNGTLDKIEKYFLSHGDFIAGTSDVTVADILAVCEMMQPVVVGFKAGEGRPKLAKWLEKVKARLQPHFDDAMKPLLERMAARK